MSWLMLQILLRFQITALPRQALYPGWAAIERNPAMCQVHAPVLRRVVELDPRPYHLLAQHGNWYLITGNVEKLRGQLWAQQ